MNTDKQRQDAYWKKTKELSNKIEKLINNGVNMKNKTKNKPKKLKIYGSGGVGKTTFAPPSDKIVIRLPKEDK